jgi:hypothetical protein
MATGELTESLRRRLDLGDLLRAALHLARSRHDAGRERLLRDLLVLLAEDRFELAVLGAYSTGKSTLLNAMLGGPYLPAGALPVTASVVRIRHGERPRALVRRRGDEIAAEVPIGDIAGYVARSQDAAPAADVVSVEVEVPAPLLRGGVTFADTPGIGSELGANTAATLHYLPDVAAAIYVTSIEQPLGAAERVFLQQVRGQTDAVFVVVNKRDLQPGDAAHNTLRVVRDTVGGVGIGPDAVFGLSALQALTARTGNDPRLLSESGLPELESSVLGLFRKQRANLLLRRVRVRTRSVLEQQHRDLRIAGAVTDPVMVGREFAARLARLAEQQQDLVRAMSDRIDTALAGLLTDRVEAWRADLRRRVDRYVEAAPPGTPVSPNTVGQLVLPDWLTRRRDETYQLMLDLIADEVGAVLATCRHPRGLGAELAGLPLDDDLPARVGWTTAELPVLALRRVTWTPTPTTRHGPLRRPRPGAPADALTAAVAATERDARRALQEMARDWLRRLAEQIDRDTAADADSFWRNLRTRPSGRQLALADAQLAQLDAIEHDATTPPERAGRSVLTAGHVGWRCVVCDRMRDALSTRLRHDQLALATRPDRQARHADTGGYCPAHTWQYAKIATPLGTAAGYAMLAARVADGLTAAARSNEPAAAPRTGTACAVCAELEAVQRDAVEQVARAGPAQTPSICLPHLHHVLACRPSPELADRLLQQLAATLRGLSVDQRSYALKREALRRGLITTEESTAHEVVLQVLAGDPALARLFGSR